MASRWLPAAVVILVVGFCGVSAAMLAELRRDTWNQAVNGANNLLAAVSQDVSRNIGLYDLSLQAVADGLQEPDLARLSPRMQQMLLFDRAASAEYLGAILVLDEVGNVVRDSGAEPPRRDNFSDRDYFQAQRARPDAGLFISAPFTRRLTGHDKVIAFSRRINHPDGSFAGVVVGTMRLDYFKDLFSRASLGPQGAMSLFRIDGIYVMRTPYDVAQIGRSIAGNENFQRFLQARSGTFTSASAIDGVQRVYSFARVGDLPLVLDVALGDRDIYAVWRSRALVIGAALVLLCGTASGLGLGLQRELQRRARAERLMGQSEAQYRLLADHATDVIIRLDRDLTRSYVSPASLPVLGYRPEELLGGHPRDLIHPDDWPDVAAIFEDAQVLRANAEATFRIAHHAGHLLWMEGRYSPVAQDGGLIVVLRDISRRKAAEQELEAANAELAHLARSDGLTGLANRRRFDETLDWEWRRAAREQTPLSLLLLDVDRFKAFNDRYGHQAGDECLRMVAAAVDSAFRRPGDMTARYGGEELVVLLPGTDEAGAAHVAERAREVIEALGLRHEGNAACGAVVTASVGCATVIPSSDQPVGAQQLVADADRALYEAKRAGRNRVVTPATMPISPATPVLSDEEARLAALAAYQDAGAAAPAESLDRIARLAAGLFGVPVAFIALIDRETQVLIGRHGLPAGRAPRAATFCAHTIAGDGPLVIADTKIDPRFAANPNIVHEAGLRFYAGTPLISPTGGHRIGTLCIVDRTPRVPLDPGQRVLLKDLAALAVDDMDRRRLEALGSAPTRPGTLLAGPSPMPSISQV